MLINERAEVIDYSNNSYKNYNFYSWLDASNNKIEPPPALRTLFWDNVIMRKARVARKNIYERDNYTCAYCGRKFEEKNLNVDHVVPKHQGGKWCWENVVCSCIKCNNKKSNRTPEQAGMPLLVKPYAPRIKIGTSVPTNERVRETWEKFLDEVG